MLKYLAGKADLPTLLSWNDMFLVAIIHDIRVSRALRIYPLPITAIPISQPLSGFVCVRSNARCIRINVTLAHYLMPNILTLCPLRHHNNTWIFSN